MFDYNRNTLPNIRSVRTKRGDGITRELFTYATPFGYRRAAEIIRPETDARAAAILYVHWLENDAPDSNRTQFIGEAEMMAKRGAVALLIETMWSERDWFIKRTQADDYENSRRQVIELRQALDLLLAQPGVDANRVAYVGHDFGAMYGVTLGCVDPRLTCYALMAGTPRFPDWYLYYPNLEGTARAEFIAQMSPLDPINNVAKLSPAPILFQFATEDRFVPKERAQEFFDAARAPKELRWYAAGHALNQDATRERVEWVTRQFQL
jgi:dienelactone hydrolase